MTKPWEIFDVPLSEWTIQELEGAILFYDRWLTVCSERQRVLAFARKQELLTALGKATKALREQKR